MRYPNPQLSPFIRAYFGIHARKHAGKVYPSPAIDLEQQTIFGTKKLPSRHDNGKKGG